MAAGVGVGEVEKNVIAVLRNDLAAGFRHVILSWVLHDRAIVERICDGLRGIEFSLRWVTLVCDEGVLRQRWAATHEAGADMEHALLRLRQARDLERTRHIDTTNLSVEDVVDAIVTWLACAAGSPPADTVG
jgi:hypothetical protein